MASLLCSEGDGRWPANILPRIEDGWGALQRVESVRRDANGREIFFVDSSSGSGQNLGIASSI